MIERLISFAEADGDGYGAVAISAERGGAHFSGAGGKVNALSDVAASRGDGVLRLGAGGLAEGAVLGIAAHTSPLGFELGEATITLQAVGVSADLPGGGQMEGRGVAWSFPAELGELSAIRTIWALLGDGSLLAIFTLRAKGVSDHAEERIGAARIGKDGAIGGWEEPLLSTEYDAAGGHVRATLELWADEDAGLPERGAGDRRSGGSAALGSSELAAARFDWRLLGKPGIGGYEIVTG